MSTATATSKWTRKRKSEKRKETERTKRRQGQLRGRQENPKKGTEKEECKKWEKARNRERAWLILQTIIENE